MNAIVVQLVARDLAKVELAGSSPVYRSGWGFADIELADSFFFGEVKKGKEKKNGFKNNRN